MDDDETVNRRKETKGTKELLKRLQPTTPPSDEEIAKFSELHPPHESAQENNTESATDEPAVPSRARLRTRRPRRVG